MKYQEGKEKFIQAWGTLGSNWGINRTMAQVHALLLISPCALSADEIMAELQISRGNANINIRALIDWGLVKKELKAGERKEFFRAEKDMWKTALQIMRERRKRELAPLKDVLIELKNVEDSDQSEKTVEFQKMVQRVDKFSDSADKILDKMSHADENWFFKIFMKLM